MTAPGAEERAGLGPIDLRQRFDELQRRHATEVRLSAVVAGDGGIAGLVNVGAELMPNPMWLIDSRRRVVARSTCGRGSDFRAPDLDALLERNGPVDMSAAEPLMVLAEPARGIARRHLLVPVRRDDCLFAWLVVAEVATRFTREDAAIAARVAFHLAGEYAVQRRVARAAWNARSALARQLVGGSSHDDDLVQAADYLGVRADADRVLVYIADPEAAELGEEELSASVGQELGVEVLATRGREGVILLVEAPEGAVAAVFVDDVKQVMKRRLAELGRPDAVVAVSGVSGAAGLHRSYRETREVVRCVERFARSTDRVVAVDDLGPARLFVANSDVGAVRRYVSDVLGGLLDGRPGTADLLRTLYTFFDTGRSVRESARRLGIHENTVRLRLAKVHDLTGLEVASDANHQLVAQTALLVIRLEGHPAVPPFGELTRDAEDGKSQKDTA